MWSASNAPAAMPPRRRRTSSRNVIKLRQSYAARRKGTVLGDGKSRWGCHVKDGFGGCPFVEGSVDTAKELGLPIVRPTGGMTKLCVNRTVQIDPGPHMKYA